MPFDAKLVLIDGTADLDQTSDVAIASMTPDAYGKAVLDIRGTGVKGLAAVMVCPSNPAALAPTVNGNSLPMLIQHSDYVADGWETLVAFPTLYSGVCKIRCTRATTAFVETDIGATLTGVGGTADTGVILWFDRALLTLNGAGDILLQRTDIDDDQFDDSTSFTTNGTGAGTTDSTLTVDDSRLSWGVYVVRFATPKHYIRPMVTMVAAGNWGRVQVLLSNSPFLDL